MSTSSPFVDFVKYELTFRTMDGELQEDENGNPVRVGTSSETLICTLRATSDPRVLQMLGADALSVGLRGRCVEPMKLPEGLKPGATSPLTVNGTAGTFTLGPTWPSMLPEISDALGDQIIGSWQAG